jgi:hypothetical protein
MNAKKLIGALVTAVAVGGSTLSVGAATANAQSSPQPNTSAVHVESAGWHGGGGWYGHGRGHGYGYGRGHGRYGGGRYGIPFWHPHWRW